VAVSVSRNDRPPDRHQIAADIAWALEWLWLDEKLDDLIIDTLVDRLGVPRGSCARSEIRLVLFKAKAQQRGVKVTW